jgi:hypothetical protein
MLTSFGQGVSGDHDDAAQRDLEGKATSSLRFEADHEVAKRR